MMQDIAAAVFLALIGVPLFVAAMVTVGSLMSKWRR
jgi:hypothetical protein